MFLDLSNESEADFDNLDSVVEDLHFLASMGLNNGGQIIELPSELDGSIDITGHIVLYNPSINNFRILPDESSLQNYESAIQGTRSFLLRCFRRVSTSHMKESLK